MKKLFLIILFIPFLVFSQQEITLGALGGNNTLETKLNADGKLALSYVTASGVSSSMAIDFETALKLNRPGFSGLDIDFCSYGEYDGIGYMYGKVSTRTTLETFWVALKIERVEQNVFQGGLLKLGIYITRPVNSSNELPLEYSLKLPLPAGVVSVVPRILDENAGRARGYFLEYNNQDLVGLLASDEAADVKIRGNADLGTQELSSSSEFPTLAGENNGHTSVRTVFLLFAENVEANAFATYMEANNLTGNSVAQYESPEKQRYAKMIVSLDSEQSQVEGDNSVGDATNLKIKVKATAVGDFDGKASSLLPPLPIKVDAQNGAFTMLNPLPAVGTDDEEVYYQANDYFLIPNAVYATGADTSIDFKGLQIYGNTNISDAKDITLLLSSTCLSLGTGNDFDYITISDSENFSIYKTQDDDASSVTITNVSPSLEVSEGNSVRLKIGLDPMPVSNTLSTEINYTIKKVGTSNITLSDFRVLGANNPFFGKVTLNAANNFSQEIEIQALEDIFIEKDEKIEFEVVGSSTSREVLIPTDDALKKRELTIKDTSADITLSLTKTNTVGELVTTDLEYKFILSETNETDAAIVLPITIGGSATLADFNTLEENGVATALAFPGTITIEPNENTATLKFTVKDDAIYESTENLSITVPAATNLLRNITAATIDAAIQDSDTPFVKLSKVGAATLEEVSNTDNITVTVSIVDELDAPIINSTGADLEVDLSYLGTAVLSEDYEVTGATISADKKKVLIPNGASSSEITITVLNDTKYEELLENAILKLVPSNTYQYPADVAAQEISFEIKDDETLDFEVTVVDNGEENALGASKNIKVNVKLLGDFEINEDISFTLTALPTTTATAGEDFVALTTFTIPSNLVASADNFITIPVFNDNVIETLETVNYSIKEVSDRSLTKTISSSIKDQRGGVTFSILPSALAKEGEVPAQSTSFRVLLSQENQTGAPILLNTGFSGTAANSDDYVLAAGVFPTEISIADNASEVMMLFEVKDDVLPEAVKDLTIKVTPAATFEDLFVANSEETVTTQLLDDDSFTATMTKLNDAEEENEKPAAFLFEMNTAPTEDVTIFLSLELGSASEAAINDFKNFIGEVVIPKNETSATYFVTPADDALFEKLTESFTLKITSTSVPNLGFNVQSISSSIKDNDEVTVSVALEEKIKEEAVFNYTISLDKENETGSPILFTQNITGVAPDAIDGLDFDDVAHFSTEIITLENGNDFKPLLYALNDDSLVEGNEKGQLTLGIDPTTDADILNRIHFVGGGTTIEKPFTILDNDAINVSIDVDETTINEGGSVSITFNLLSTISKDVKVLPIFSGTALPSDFSDTFPTELVFTPGETEKTIVLNSISNNLLEKTKELKVAIDDSSNEFQAINDITVFIDENSPLSLTLTGTAGKEGVTPIEFTLETGVINKTGAAITLFSILESTDATYSDNQDFIDSVDSFIIKEGESSGTLVLNTYDDTAIEIDEKVELQVYDSSDLYLKNKLSVTPLIGTTTLEEKGFTVEIESQDINERSTGETILFILKDGDKTKVNRTGMPIELDLSWSGVADQSDFETVLPSTLEIGDGERQSLVTIQAKDDALLETREQVILTITGINVSNDSRVVSIKNEFDILDYFDRTENAIAIEKIADAMEEDATQKLIFKINSNIEGYSPRTELKVTYSGTANQSDIIEDLPTTIFLEEGEKEKILEFTANRDAELEPTETLKIAIKVVVNDGDEIFYPNNYRANAEGVIYDVRKEDFAVVNNGISINGDGANDKFIISDVELARKNSLHILNIYGHVVFETNSYMNNWYGTDMDGNYLPTGNYYYIFEYEYSKRVQDREIARKSATKGTLYIRNLE